MTAQRRLALLAVVVSQRAAQVTQGGRERRVAHRHAGPDQLQELVARNHAIAAVQQTAQESKRSCLNLNRRAATPELLTRLVELEVSESEASPSRQE
jgi:hypothetical protein